MIGPNARFTADGTTTTVHVSSDAVDTMLALDGQNATLTVKKQLKNKDGTSSETVAQHFRIDGEQCLVSR